MSTADAAAILGVTVRNVAALARRGTLSPVVRGAGRTGAMVFALRDIEALRAERVRRAREVLERTAS